MKITLKRSQREVPYHRKGRKPTYRWAPAYIIISPVTGAELQPYSPSLNEAKATVRELFVHNGEKVEFEIV